MEVIEPFRAGNLCIVCGQQHIAYIGTDSQGAGIYGLSRIYRGISLRITAYWDVFMDEKAYIKERLDDQIEWYSKKSKRSQLWFKSLRIVELVAAITIPFLAGFVSESKPEINVIIGLLGVVVAFVAGIISLNKFQEIWIEYRTTSETLKHHKYLFLTKSTPYDKDDAFQSLVQTVEQMISKENSNWGNYISKTETQGTESSSSGH